LPIYEYKCKKCGNSFELRRGLADSDDDIKCPVCEAGKPERIFSIFATGSMSSKGLSSKSCAPGGFS